MILKNRILSALSGSGIICLFYLIPAIAMVQLPADMHAWAISSIENVYKEKFKQAEVDAKRIIKKYPEHPAGYFFYAAILNSHMEYLQSEKHEIEFYHNCDLAISKGEEILEKKPDDAWTKFFIGGANGLKGTYESRYGRWITAFKHGWRGVVLFRELLETSPEMEDAFFGIATYDYWRSAKTKLLWWLPGVVDKREVAIEVLYKMRANGIYIKESASVNLVDILYNEEQYAAALEVANAMLATYPSNLICWWGKAKAQLGLHEYKEAEKSFNYILKRIESEPFETHFNIVLCYFYLGKVNFGLKRYTRCMTYFKKMKSYKFTGVSEKRLEDIFDDADSFTRKARRRLSKD